MRTEEKKRAADLTVFRAVFALEEGGGEIKIEAEDKNRAWKILEKIDPKAYQKVKNIEEVEVC